MDTQQLPATPTTTSDPKQRRLLICEVLMEEYESLAQPLIDFSDIRTQIAQHRIDCERINGDELIQREYEFNDRILKQFYSMMAFAQREAAEDFAAAEYELRHSVLAENFKNLSADELKRVSERAVVAQIYGHMAELRAKFTGQFIDVTDQQKREAMVDQAVLEALIKETRGAPQSTQSKLSEGNGGGPRKKEGITRKQAERVHAGTLRSALCLSGGGIRSATFNLGILQGLARHGLLDKFDFLSTVSGGGFIGGWLSAWICREGMPNVMSQLRARANPMQPDPKPVEYLRVYSNYLSPQPGLLSADTWTLVASILRNLMLTWLVFLPVLMLFLLLPRLWTSILLRSFMHAQYSIPISLVVGAFAGMWALTYIGRSLPSANAYESGAKTEHHKGGQGKFILRSLVWLVVSAAALSIFSWTAFHLKWSLLDRFPFYLLVGAVVVGPGWLVCLTKSISATPPEKRTLRFFFGLGVASALILLALLIIAYIARYATHSFLPGNNPNELVYSIFSVPLILLLMLVAGALIAGFTSRFSKDDDQEWWARAGAWVFIVIVGWSIIHLLVLYGPLLLLTLVPTLQELYSSGLKSLGWSDIGKIGGTVLGIVSGIITLAGGFSAKTPANAKEAQRVGPAAKLLSILTSLVSPIFLAFVFIVISLGTNFLIVSRPAQFLNRAVNNNALPYPTNPALYADWHLTLLRDTPFRLIVLLSIGIVLLVVFIGPLISTNAFSLQFMWRNRIIRAYLGASHEKRRPNSFTGFDTFDNLQMFELRKQPEETDGRPLREGRPADDIRREPDRKLLHILNLALNLSGGEKLQWQDRRAESFTVSPLHAGSYWLGYRRSSHYGGQQGISLGAAIAISGAFVSPNMGYMMTSPVVRFLMALFNVRFGAWLGNPGPAGDRPDLLERILSMPLRLFGSRVGCPFLLASPSLSVLPFISEAFGNIDDKSPYVYLSDGGHFENLGLYEMVLRRCRFIVVSDASTDPDYAFQSLAMSIRQIRVDLGVPIELPELSINAPSQDLKNKYCAIGTIRYSCVDRDPEDYTTRDKDFDGVLIYLKPSLIGEEPRDVVNYWQGSNSFPQEVITDQWFSEAQFESYRALGSHMIDTICGGESRNPINLAAFATRVRDHNEIDFRSFREKISYMALEEVFKEGMKQESIDSFRLKVRRFAERIFRS
jgi:hypothetical protein